MKKMVLVSKTIVILGFIGASIVGLDRVHAAGTNTLKAGTAKVNITPKTPIPMSGYGSRKDPFKGVHDELFARVISFDDGEKKAVIIAADVIGFSHEFWKDLTTEIKKEMDINPFMVGPEGTTPVAVDARMSVEKVK